ncbi:MAG: hypothetical protein IKW45_04505 [Clostridia bacterium]|nr:hypothetical protein [Clostridia bacterium]
MKKKVAIIISIVLVLVIAFVGVWIWGANNPEVHFSIGKPVEETDIYVEHIGVGSSDRMGFIPMTEEKTKQIREIYESMMKVAVEITETAEAPTHLELNIAKDDEGKTVCTYHGTLTKDGVTSDYEQSWTFDYKYHGEIEYAG